MPLQIAASPHYQEIAMRYTHRVRVLDKFKDFKRWLATFHDLANVPPEEHRAKDRESLPGDESDGGYRPFTPAQYQQVGKTTTEEMTADVLQKQSYLRLLLDNRPWFEESWRSILPNAFP